MNPAANMLEWQKNVAEFLSSRRKYRVFSWECGPTLLDELHCKRQCELDYIKIGIAYTPIIAMSAGLISLIITRKAGFAGVVTSGLILFGIVATLTIDYQMTKKKGGEVSEKECVELLQELEKMPQHWWWPWSKSIGEEDELCIEKLSYLYNYYELGGEMGKVSDIINKAYQLLPRLRSSGSEVQIAEEACSEKREVEEINTISRLVKAIYKVEEGEMRLKHALKKLNFEWLLLYLDRSLIGVREEIKSEDEHNKYFESMIKQMQKLSFTYHPDKQESKDDQIQKTINQTVLTLRNIHQHVMKMGKVTEKQAVLSNYIEGQEYCFIYRMYSNIPLSILSSSKNISEIVKISPIDGMSALFELYSLAHQEEGYVMVARNQYLRDAVASIESLAKKSQGIRETEYRSLNEVKTEMVLTWEQFNKAHDEYAKMYDEHWLQYLECLSKRCEKLELLKVIQPEIEKLLKASYEQYEMLLRKSYNIGADEDFVLPMLEYQSIIKTYYEFVTHLHKEEESCYSYCGYCCNKPELEKISEEINFILGKENTALKSTKENIKKYLYVKELLQDVEKLVNAYIKGDENELKERIKKYYKENKKTDEKTDEDEKSNEEKIGELTKKEIGNVILFMLEHIKCVLSNKFKEKRTYFERNKEEREQIRKDTKEAIKNAEEAMQAREEFKQKAEQEAQRAEQAAQRATKLAEALKKMGVDPNAVLDDVDINNGAGAEISK